MDNQNLELSVNCGKCGATNKFTAKNIPTFCSFCGAALPDMKKHADEAIKIALERQRHEMDMEKADKSIKVEELKAHTQETISKRMKSETKSKLIQTIIMLIIMAGLVIYLMNTGLFKR